MPNVTDKPFMLGAIWLNVVILSVVASLLICSNKSFKILHKFGLQEMGLKTFPFLLQPVQ
jgi:hypothetical protein